MPMVLLNFYTKQFQPQAVWADESAAPGDQAVVSAMPKATNLRAARGKRVLLVADADNWDYSLKRHGLRLGYRQLLSRLNAEADCVYPVAVLTSAPGDSRRAGHLEDCGWHVVSIPWETVTTCQGTRKLANADMDLAFEWGCLSIISGCDTALVGTGDGDLAVSIARGLRRLRRQTPISIHTLSVVGASSSRLWQRNDLFDSSVMIGEDMLESSASRHHFSCHRISKGSYHAV